MDLGFSKNLDRTSETSLGANPKSAATSFNRTFTILIYYTHLHKYKHNIPKNLLFPLSLPPLGEVPR